MLWLIGNRGMLGSELSRQLTENKIEVRAEDEEDKNQADGEDNIKEEFFISYLRSQIS